ncbi:hypothetical protein AMK15_17030 [Streptomyces sp. MJM1172]|nr:hypothetical protein AMK15_17030 [Streptomyces sp. MJM1172]
MRRGAGLAAAGAAGLGPPPAQAAVAAPAGNPASVPAGTALIKVAAGSSRWQAGVANQDSSTTLQGIAFHTGAGAPRPCFGITNNSGANRQFDRHYKV